MGQFFDEIPEFLITWIKQQRTFWVASAPLTADGCVNISPKGVDGTFHVLDAHRVWYEDLTGSGAETIAHVRENGRITVMFSAFEGPPRITRLFGKGTAYEFGTPEYDELLPPEKRQKGSRAVIMVDVYKVGTTCGYAVPFYTFKSNRTRLLELFARKEDVDVEAESDMKMFRGCTPPRPQNGLKQYWLTKNTKSLDGLPAMLTAHESANKFNSVKVVYKKDDERVPNSGVLSVLRDANTLVGFLLGIFVSVLFVQYF